MRRPFQFITRLNYSQSYGCGEAQELTTRQDSSPSLSKSPEKERASFSNVVYSNDEVSSSYALVSFASHARSPQVPSRVA